MAGNAERLAIELEARVEKLEKGMGRAQAIANKAYAGMKRSSGSATKAMERDMQRSTNRINQALASTSTQIGALGRTFAGAFAGGLFAGGITGLAAGMREIVRQTASLNDEAARAGLSLRVFQEWKAVAEDTRIPLDAIVDAFKELNIRADEFVTTGKGSAQEAFSRLGMDPADVQKRLRDPSALMLEIIRRTRALGDVAAATRIFDEIFGGTGAEQAIRLLNLADGEIQNIISSAHESGRVLDDEIVKRAEEIDREFNILWRNFEASAKTAILNVSVALRDGLVRDMANIADYAKDLWNDPNLQNLNRLLWGDPIDSRINNAFDASQAGKGSRELADALQERYGRKPLTLDVTPPPAGGQRKAAVDAALREQAAVNKLIDALTFELEMIGKTDLEREKANALRQAGAAATDEQRQKIEGLVESIHREKAAHEAAQKAAEARKTALDNLFEMANDGIASLIDGSASAEETLKRLAAQLALAVAQAALLGTGPLAGLFPSGGLQMFPDGLGYASAGGFASMLGYATGTANTGGRRGEPRGIVHGQEAVIPLPSGGRVPVMVQGGGMTVKIYDQRTTDSPPIEQRETIDERGQRSLEFYVRKTAQDEVTRPSAQSNRALRGMFGLSNQVVRR